MDNPVVLAVLAGIIIWGVTIAGAGVVFVRRTFSRRLLDTMLGFAAGVMIAVCYWSLLAPALEMSAHLGRLAFAPVACGMLVGAGMLRLIDMVLPHRHAEAGLDDGLPSGLPRSTLLALAISLHNIPEGLAVGVAFGATGTDMPGALAGAMTLALGIGVQKFPEGLAVSVPLLREGMAKPKAFACGVLSGLVVPLAAWVGALTVSVATSLLPYALSFAAGAMLFVVIEEVIPESHAAGNGDMATTGSLIGFVLMMSLAVALT